MNNLTEIQIHEFKEEPVVAHPIPAVNKMDAAQRKLRMEQRQHELEEIVPGLCSGACSFNLMASAFCLLCLLVPLCVLLPLALHFDDSSTARTMLLIVMGVMIGLGLLYCCASLYPVFAGGVCCLPEPYPQTGPLLLGNATPSIAVAVKKIYVIVNPYGGMRTGPTVFRTQAKPVFDKHGVVCEVIETQYAGHTVDLAATLDFDGYDGLCVVGGDGSLHELINGLLHRPDHRRIAVGLIPGGSGNSICVDLGFSNGAKAAEAICRGLTVPIDANKLTDDGDLCVYSVNEVSWGLLGEVGVSAEAIRFVGPARYNLCGVWGVMKNVGSELKLTVEDAQGQRHESSGVFLTAFSNITQNFGKELRAAPQAKMDDGLMDLVFIQKATRGHLLQMFQHLPKGLHHSNPKINFFQARRAIFEPAAPKGVINIDGEILPFKGALKIECIPAAYRLFLDPSAYPKAAPAAV